MASGYKHFSHKHNLVIHEMPEGAAVSCSGCNSPATKTVYICWQCHFYLHEQCFHATRSREHPSHPRHPLTLVPYPTYPSNSFICNSCKTIGTGFSYACSDCDFDLHVQCAYSVASTTNFHQPHDHISYPNHKIAPVVPNFHIIPSPPPVPILAPYPTNIMQDPYMAQNVSTFSVPATAQTSFPSSQNGDISRAFTAPLTNPTQDSVLPSHYGESAGKPVIKHFSHPHGLALVNLKHETKKIVCSGCEETLIGNGYACIEENCAFQLDESCFNLEKEIMHKSHPSHPLTLLSSSPYKTGNGEFICSACWKDGTGFDYHCSMCEHDLHVKCANLKETVKRDDHEHVLTLFYESQWKGDEYTFSCDVCKRVMSKDEWTYYCEECDYGIHLDCGDGVVCDEPNGGPDDVDTRTDKQRFKEANEIASISAIGRQYALDNI